jgi:FdhE protein
LIATVDDTRWRQRAARARLLAERDRAAAEPLAFYASIAEVQGAVAVAYAQTALAPGVFANRLDPSIALKAMPQLLAAFAHAAPAALTSQLATFDLDDRDRWLASIAGCWATAGESGADSNAIHAVIIEALLQPFAECAADRAEASDRANGCPHCGGRPMAAVLRDQAQGARRSMVCGFCLTEWPAPRIGCPACGESQFETLPVFRSDEFAAVRIDACDSCRNYIKTIDLSRDGSAIPMVDDVASLALDLWADGEGYRRIRHNLLRL